MDSKSTRINVIRNDLLTVRKGFVVHGVNAMGRFNAGVARQVRQYWPNAYADYMKAFHGGRVDLGLLSGARISVELVVLNGCTQKIYGRDPAICYTNYEAVGKVFANIIKLSEFDAYQGIPKIISFPRIGCGLGGGTWEKVESQILANVPDNWRLDLYVKE